MPSPPLTRLTTSVPRWDTGTALGDVKVKGLSLGRSPGPRGGAEGGLVAASYKEHIQQRLRERGGSLVSHGRASPAAPVQILKWPVVLPTSVLTCAAAHRFPSVSHGCK